METSTSTTSSSNKTLLSRMLAAHNSNPTNQEADEEKEGGGETEKPQSLLRRDRSENPIVFLEFIAAGRDLGRITLELRADIVPVCAENFRQLCTGERGKSKKSGVNLHYKGTRLHRITADKYIVGGDLNRGDGTCSECAFGTPTGKFSDENFILRHTGPGVLGMVNLGPDSNGSQFYITTSETHWLDGKSVVVGSVIDQASLDCLFLLERLGTDWGATKRQVLCCNSGQKEVGKEAKK
jgi:peptidylprolyl isomerase